MRIRDYGNQKYRLPIIYTPKHKATPDFCDYEDEHYHILPNENIQYLLKHAYIVKIKTIKNHGTITTHYNGTQK
jgi:hypothetical protein